jgi:hypothetical protein
MTEQKNNQLLQAMIEIGQQGDNTDIEIKGKSTISTKKLITLISICLLILLTVFAQISTVGKVILEAIRHLLPF